MHDKWTGPELDSLTGKASLTRREVIVTSLAVGFAAAAGPVAADTVITTGSEGLTAGEVKIPRPTWRSGLPRDAGDGRPVPRGARGAGNLRRARAHQGSLPPLRETGLPRRRAEMYARQGDPSKFTDWKQLFAELVSKVPDAQVMSDLDATVAWAGKSGSGDVKRVGVTGFCWGGRITWLYAAHSSSLKAGVAWYGRLAGQATELQPKYPLDVAADLKAPVLGLYGGQDQGIPLADVEKMRAALAAAKSPPRSWCFRTPARFPGRLSSELPGGRRPRGLGAVPRLVPQARGRLEAPEHTDVGHERQPVAVLAHEFDATLSVGIELEIGAAGVAPVEQVRDLAKTASVPRRSAKSRLTRASTDA